MNASLFRLPFFFILTLSLAALTACDRPKDRQAEAKFLAEDRQWEKKVLSQMDNAEAHLTTNWKEGRLFYVLDVAPYNGSFDRYISDTLAHNRLSIHLEDMSAVNLLTIDVPIKTMVSLKNSGGEPALLEARGEVRCSMQMYNAVADWAVTWTFPRRH